MIRRPPRSTLFPTRRSSDLYSWDGRVNGAGLALNLRPRAADLAAITVPNTACSAEGIGAMPASLDAGGIGHGNGRSEEHTSELQSHSDLVCRLLLEKKKKKC